LQGKFDLANLDVEIPIITPNERDFLLETARSLNRYFPSSHTASKNDKQFVYSETAINDFNNNYDIIELFTKHGWTVVKEDDESFICFGTVLPHNILGTIIRLGKTFTCFFNLNRL